MADELEKVTGPLEADVLRILWATGEGLGVRQVLDRLNEDRIRPLAYTTVMTVLSRLVDKQILRRQLRGRGYIYEPSVHDAAEIAVRGVLRDFGPAAVSHFLAEARSDPALLRRLRRVVEESS